MANKTLIGKSLGKYRIVDALGRGGMAEVYRAFQENLDRYVAVKVMHAFLADEENFLARFQREAKAMASLNHNNIVGVYDFDVQDEMYYIVMEYVSGGTLKQKLTTLSAKGEHLPLSEAVQLVLEIADALSYAHGRGMVHRDIKPGNIMINESGHAVLTDFGIAKILSGPTVTATGAMIGTPAYMSPEQGLGQPGDERSDLYALGVLFYQMVTGKLPYDADTPLAVILKHVNEPVPRPVEMNPSTPDAVQMVIIKAMAKDPNERYQTAIEFIDDLTAAAASSDLALAAGVVYGAFRDTPTQPPVSGVQATRIAPADATALSPQATGAAAVGATRIAPSDQIMATEIAQPAPPVPPQAAPAKKRSLLPIILVLLLFLILAGAAGGFFIFAGGGEDPTPTPEEVIVIAPEDTPTEVPTDTATPEPGPTADNVSTAVARIALTLTAQPTETVLPTETPTPTATQTPDATATFLAGCEEDVELVNSYTFQNENTSNAPVGVNFAMNWEFRNSGDCPLPAGLLWTFQEGEEFEQEGPIELEGDLFAGDEVLLETVLVAPDRTGTYASTWQFEDEDGIGVGPEIEFEVLVFVPQTATPRATVTPAASPTVAQAFGYNLNIGNCVDIDGDWECTVSIIPFGGVGPYTALVSDADPPSEYNGDGPFFHTIRSRRCNPWVNTFTIQDSGTGQTFTESKFYDPKIVYGCTEP